MLHWWSQVKRKPKLYTHKHTTKQESYLFNNLSFLEFGNHGHSDQEMVMGHIFANVKTLVPTSMNENKYLLLQVKQNV